MTATLQSRIRISDEVLFRDLGGEAVLLHLETGQYYGLDPVGTRMWELLREHHLPGAVCQAMLAEYEVTEERLREDLVRFIGELASLQLVAVEE